MPSSPYVSDPTGQGQGATHSSGVRGLEGGERHGAGDIGRAQGGGGFIHLIAQRLIVENTAIVQKNQADNEGCY